LVVKDTTYPLSEFLFGKDFRHNELDNIVFEEGKKMYQITIYLSPGDCHRYYSPNNMNVSSRVYIPGFLEPVKPSYVEIHPAAFLTNERVTLVGKVDKTDDYLFTTFVGALNVGSITLSFDKFLKTNQRLAEKDITNPHFFLINYTNMPSEIYN
jgi:phosphatidylserine decarboxylase